MANKDRWEAQRGTRSVRVANCSGANGDPGYQMYRQATQGPVDFITGDYLAELNLAENAEKVALGQHEGWQQTAFDGIKQSLDVLQAERIKVVINGGALNPAGLAEKVQELVDAKNYNLQVAYVYGDDLKQKVIDELSSKGTLPPHLDSHNKEIHLHHDTEDLKDVSNKPIVSVHAYLGARGIVQALELGADIVICGRVADASPVIGAAWYWHGWKDSSYNELAGALVAGHLIECSAYVTGANFAGFYEYDLDTLIDLPFGIAEIASDGTSVITKHENTSGMVNVDTVTCQFLYELQGNIYLNSDVSADVTQIRIEEVGKDRVRLSHVSGYPPPATTKLAIFYRGGYQAELLFNATGYAWKQKWELMEKQFRYALSQEDLKYQVLDFQQIGTPAYNPRSQAENTVYLRVFAQADEQRSLYRILQVFSGFGMQHFSGMHLSMDFRTAMPKPFLAYYPATIEQNSLEEGVALLGKDGKTVKEVSAGHPPKYRKLETRENYETKEPFSDFGSTKKVALGDVVFARSGDKGANINFGVFARKSEHYPWLQSFFTCKRLQELMGDDWRSEFFIERVEFPNILAVHYVIYGPLGRGVSSCRLLDSLGKGFADYIRCKVVDVPEQIINDVEAIRSSKNIIADGRSNTKL